MIANLKTRPTPTGRVFLYHIFFTAVILSISEGPELIRKKLRYFTSFNVTKGVLFAGQHAVVDGQGLLS